VNYTKPEVVLNARAVKAVQGSMSKTFFRLDANNVDLVSPAAYEADE